MLPGVEPAIVGTVVGGGAGVTVTDDGSIEHALVVNRMSSTAMSPV
jgi:hypothetical protein